MDIREQMFHEMFYKSIFNQAKDYALNYADNYLNRNDQYKPFELMSQFKFFSNPISIRYEDNT